VKVEHGGFALQRIGLLDCLGAVSDVALRSLSEARVDCTERTPCQD
jgi:hypothetical protein